MIENGERMAISPGQEEIRSVALQEGLLSIELTHSPERHQVVPFGGRVKMARQPLDVLYAAAEPVREAKTLEGGMVVAGFFQSARSNPRGARKRSFFPLRTGDIKKISSGPAFYRDLLKTDQGPPGMFCGFVIEDRKEGIPTTLIGESGLAIPEEFLLKQLREKSIDLSILNEVQELFKAGDEHETREALDRLVMECEQHGVEANRRASVGRLPFFFIRPAIPEEGIAKVSSATAERVSKTVVEVINRIEAKASKAKVLVQSGKSIEEATQLANQLETLDSSRETSILYCQPDVILRRDGSFVIDTINIPDVVFFLTQVDSQDNNAFTSVQEVVSNLKETVIDRLVERIKDHQKDEVVLLTRDEVVDNKEDTLELKEIDALIGALKERGINAEIVKLSSSKDIRDGSVVVLLNPSPSAEGFKPLLDRSAQEDLICYPDPFVLLFKDQAHTYHEREVDQVGIAKLKSVVEPIHYKSQVDCYRQQLALETLLNQLELNEGDILYFVGEKQIIPVFRYDLKGISVALNALGDEDKIKIRVLDFKPEDGMMVKSENTHLAAFRFMFVAKQ